MKYATIVILTQHILITIFVISFAAFRAPANPPTAALGAKRLDQRESTFVGNRWLAICCV